MRLARRHAYVLALVGLCGVALTGSDRDHAPAQAIAPSSRSLFAFPSLSPPRRGAVAPPNVKRLDVLVTSAGAPVDGGDVMLGDGSGPVMATAVIDRDGLAHFADLPPGPYEVWARRGRDVSPLVRAMLDGETEPDGIELALEPAASLHGRLIADGPLPPEARVIVSPVAVDHAVRIADVDDSGGFAIDGLPYGAWRVEVDVVGFVAAAEHVADIAKPKQGAKPAVEPPPPATIDVRLLRAGVVVGMVVDGGGAPVANATIVLRAQGPPIAGAPSAVVPVVDPSRTRLRWVHPLAGARQMPIREGRRFGALRPGVRPTECGHGHCGVDLGTRRGEVVHAVADGIVSLVFTEIRKDAGRYVAIDHASGIRTFYMHLDDIRADLEIGQAIRAGDAVGTVGSTGFARINPHLHFAMSQERQGRAWFFDPEPILRYAVVLAVARSLDPVDERPITSVASATDAAAPARLVSDALGVFRIEGLAPGTYVAAAFDVALAPGVSTPFVIRSGEETPGVTVALSPGVVVHGRVTGPRGVVAGARVIAEEGFGETTHKVATAFTDLDGNFQLRALSGKLTLSVTAAGHADAERAIGLGSQGPKRREDFELAPATSRLVGQVFGASGAPAAGVAVRIIEGATSRRRAVTGPDGTFAIDRLASGSYVVELSSIDHPATRAAIVTDSFKEIRLREGGSLRVLVLDAHTAAALPNIAVEASGPGDRSIASFTGVDGAFVLRGLAPGTWKLHVRTSGYVVADQSIEIRRGAQDARIELSRGATLAGVVRDRWGTRVANARVFLGTASTRTDVDGNFRLVDVPTGKSTLRAELSSTSTSSLPLHLAPGDELVTLELTLSE